MSESIKKKISVESELMKFSAGVTLPRNYDLLKKIILGVISDELDREYVKSKICSKMYGYKFEIKIVDSVEK